jgi:formate hydrogenlyase transcriptional activator
MQTVAEVSERRISKSYLSQSRPERKTLPSSEQYRALLEVGEAIVTQRDLPGLLRDLATRLRCVAHFDYLELVLHDRVTDTLRLQLLEPPDLSVPLGIQLPEPGAYAWAWRNQQPLIVSSLSEAKRWPAYHQWARGHDLNSLCALPLTTARNRLGVIGFACRVPDAYTPGQADFLRLLANQVAVAVENALNYETALAYQQQLAHERDRVRLLLEVNNAVVSHLCLDELFPAVSACLRKVVQYDGAALVLHDQQTRSFRVHLLRLDKNESYISEGEVGSDCCAKGPAGMAMNTRQPLVFGEAELQTLAAESPCARNMVAEGVKSYCSVPLMSHDRAMGAMNVGRLTANAFSSEDVALLGEVAKQVAIAVENAQAYRELAELKDKLAKEKGYLEEEVRTEHNFGEICGNCSALRKVLKEVETVGPTNSTVLIQGETGTGKELIARALHDLSPRRDRTFVKLNCAAIPTGLLESELFGHEKGAFTGAITQRVGRFELANGGTLFLDEIGDIPLALQPKLLRALQEQEFERLGSTRTVRVDVRLVAATNRDLAQMVADGAFRSDLFYRLNVFPVLLPPLRERTDDIPLLVRHFTQKFAQRMGRRIESIPTEVMDALLRYPWPGNVRELQNVIERAVILSQNGRLQVDTRSLVGPEPPQKLNGQLDAHEREVIEAALRASHGRVSGPNGAARRLGIPNTTLEFRIKKLGIDKFQFRRKGPG